MSDKPTLSPGAFLRLVRTPSGARQRARVYPQRHGGKVLRMPCPDGSIALVGVAPDGRWVAEWKCLECDWRDSMIDRMARHVRHSRVVGIPRVALV